MLKDRNLVQRKLSQKHTTRHLCKTLIENPEKGAEQLYQTLNFKQLDTDTLEEVNQQTGEIRKLLTRNVHTITEQKVKERTYQILKTLMAIHDLTVLLEKAERKETDTKRRIEYLIAAKETLENFDTTKHLFFTKLVKQLQKLYKPLENQINRENHYKALENEADSATPKNGACIVVGRNIGPEVGRTLQLHTVYSVTKHGVTKHGVTKPKKSLIAVIPGNTVGALQRNAENLIREFKQKRGKTQNLLNLEEAPFWLLKPTNELLLKTALTLYAETPELNFEQCLKAAEKL